MVGYAAESGSRLSYRDATGMALMTETVAPFAKPVPRPRSRTAETVSASALAQHLDCSRTYIVKLEAEGVIQQQGSGFPLDQSRVAYLRYLRRERRQSPRSEADADLQRAKSELIRLRIREKQRELIPLTEASAHMEEMIGLFTSGLAGFAARCGGRDMTVRRAIDKAVYDLRLEIATACARKADECGEPPIDDDTA
jgi:hypothetical protein